MSDNPDDDVTRAKRDVRVTVRVPRRLRAAMRRLAESDRRSLSDWLIVQLEDVVAARDAVATKGGRAL